MSFKKQSPNLDPYNLQVLDVYLKMEQQSDLIEKLVISATWSEIKYRSAYRCSSQNVRTAWQSRTVAMAAAYPWQGKEAGTPNKRRPPPSSDLPLNQGSRQRSMPRSERVTVRDDTGTEWERASRTTQMGRRESRKKTRDKSKFNYNQRRGLNQRKRGKRPKQWTEAYVDLKQNEYNSESYPTGQI